MGVQLTIETRSGTGHTAGEQLVNTSQEKGPRRSGLPMPRSDESPFPVMFSTLNDK